MRIKVIEADYLNPQHEHDIQFLLDTYAKDPMGGGEPLSAEVKNGVVNALSKIPHAFSIIAYIDEHPAGLVNGFEAFSTFKCKPLINIHDLAVIEKYRGLGLSQIMLKKVEEIAARKGCCKITLEVLSGNEAAKAAYKKFGFSGYELDPKAGKALFWQKQLLT